MAPWTDRHAALHRQLRAKALLPKDNAILIAVSGGQDSLALTQLLRDLQPKWGWTLAIGHCDHQWRTDSRANADHVEALAESWGLPCHRVTAETRTTSEAAARHWRYRQLQAIAEAEQYPTIVTGHTASDRAETLLYNLTRGSGTDGLAALTWSRPLLSPLSPTLRLVRPLLNLSRSDTAEICQTNQLPIWVDETNHDRHYARNRIRHNILPELSQINPQAERHLAQTAELLQADIAYLDTQAQALYESAIGPANPNPADPSPADPSQLNRSALRNQPLALQRRVIRQFLHQAQIGQASYEQIDAIVTLITAPNRSRTAPLAGGQSLGVDGDWIGWMGE
jgi:tRNA(Ile)-lysidine synthase